MNKISGLELSENFYLQEVVPLLKEFRVRLRYAAALIGPGSEVLGYDDDISQDHHWGPRLLFFLTEEDFEQYGSELRRYFSEKISPEFEGYSTHWTDPLAEDSNNQFLQPGTAGNINHRIEIASLPDFLTNNLGVSSVPFEDGDWCTIPEHHLLEITAGRVFHDDIGELTATRMILKYYPEQIWYWKFAALWSEVSELMQLMGRTGSRGDNLGSQLLCNRLVSLGIRLKFAIERQYVPYPKWVGRAFRELPGTEILALHIDTIFYIRDWKVRQDTLIEFFIDLGNQFNTLNIIPLVNFKCAQFFTRPYYVVDIGSLVELLTALLPPNLQEKVIQMGTVNECIGNSRLIDCQDLLSLMRPLFE